MTVVDRTSLTYAVDRTTLQPKVVFTGPPSTVAGPEGPPGPPGGSVSFEGQWADSPGREWLAMGDSPTDTADMVGHGGQLYICVVTHVAGSTNEPGVGVDWETYWTQPPPPAEGLSAYDLAVANGDFVGTEEEFTEALVKWFPFDADPDAALATDSDLLIATQKAVKAYVDAQRAAVKSEILGGVGPAFDTLVELAAEDAAAAAALAAGLATKQPSHANLTDISGIAKSDDDVVQVKGGVYVGRTMAQLRADLGTVLGWIPATGTFTSPTASGSSAVGTSGGTLVPSVDWTTSLQASDRIAFTQDGVDKVGILTAVASGLLTFYLGTGATLTGTAVTNVRFSKHATPQGLVKNPLLWTATLINDATAPSQPNPVSGTVYNLGSLQGVCPIGAWSLHLNAAMLAYTTSARDAEGTIDVSLTATGVGTGRLRINARVGSPNVGTVSFPVVAQTGGEVEEDRLFAAPTTLFLTAYTLIPGLATITANGSIVPTRLRAVCAYL